MNAKDLKRFYDTFREDKRDIETPFKAVIPGNPVQRFKTKAEALTFFSGYDGRCLISHCTNKKVRILAYKFK